MERSRDRGRDGDCPLENARWRAGRWGDGWIVASCMTSMIATWAWIWTDPGCIALAAVLSAAVCFVVPFAAIDLLIEGAWIHGLLVASPLLVTVALAATDAGRGR